MADACGHVSTGVSGWLASAVNRRREYGDRSRELSDNRRDA